MSPLYSNEMIKGAYPSNYSQFEADGTLVAYGDATCYDDCLPGSINSLATGTSAPSFTTYNGNLAAYEFPGTGITSKVLHIGFQLPHSMAVNTDITPHLHLFVPDEATGGIIKFTMEYTWADIGSTGALTPLTIPGTITRAANAGIDNNIILSFGDITPGAGQGGISSILMCRIVRNPADTGDTFAASVWLKGADIHFKKDMLGSRLPTTK